MLNEYNITDFEKRKSLILEVKTSGNVNIFTFFLFFLFISFIFILSFIPWLQTVSGSGKVIAYAPLERQQNIESPIDGKVVKWYVIEGKAVQKGDPIALISDNDPEYMNRLQEQKELLKDSLNASKSRGESFNNLINTLTESRINAINAADFRLKMAKERIIAAENSLVASEATFETAKLNKERQISLDKNGLTSTRNLELALLEYDRAFTEKKRNVAFLKSSKQEYNALESDKNKIDKDGNASISNAKASYASALSEIARVNSEINRINTTISRQSTQLVKSPKKGTIFRLRVNEDTEMVKSGDSIASLVPDTGILAVELLVNGNDIPLVIENKKVRLQFEGWPALQFNAWPSVAIGTFGGKVVLVDSTDNGKGKFRVLVLPDKNEKWPEKKYLRQGVRANGWIIINQVPLWYELWRQFNGFPPIVENENNDEKSSDNVIKVKSKK